MKVLQVNSVCGVGSTGRIATDIDALLKEQGHESYIAFGRSTPINCDTTIRIGSKYDTYKHLAATRIFDSHGFGSKIATKKFIKRLIELDPDVIHLHNIHGYYINIEILFEYLKIANKPVVWTLHDCWAFTGHCVHFEYSGCQCWRGEKKCIEKRSYPASYLFNDSKKNYRRKKHAFTGVENLTIITPSIWLADLVSESFLREYPIEVINNGIDLEVFKPNESSFRADNNLINKYIILGVANVWTERKGYNFFLELSSMLEEDEIIVLVGVTGKQRHQLPKNIIGVTRTDSIRELAEIYTTADVFVNPTLEDVLGMVNIEALACGTPVVTFKTGGTIESVDASCGYIVEQESLIDLLEKLKCVKHNGKEAYFANAIIKAQTNYKNKERFQDYINIYHKALLD